MTMTHKDALGKAAYVLRQRGITSGQMEAALRAYLDARGLVMVKMEPTGDMIKAWDNYKGEVMWGMRDVHYPSVGHGSYAAMLSAAPDPFKE